MVKTLQIVNKQHLDILVAPRVHGLFKLPLLPSSVFQCANFIADDFDEIPAVCIVLDAQKC